MNFLEQEILTLAQEISGAGERELELLELLCVASRQTWEARLREGVSIQDCEAAFRCAAALTAAGELAVGRGGSDVASFTAGEISVRERGAADSAALAQGLRQAAERLMEPYVQPMDFYFKGVRG